MTTKTDELKDEIQLWLSDDHYYHADLKIADKICNRSLDLLGRCLSALKDAEARYIAAREVAIERYDLNHSICSEADDCHCDGIAETKIDQEIESRLRGKNV